jgi:hypothetical protein
MKHEITLDGLREWQAKEYIIYASCTTPNKQLRVTLRGSYEVWHEGVRVYETMQPLNSVEIYNSIN